jgi:Helicase conserved C-terminal domain.
LKASTYSIANSVSPYFIKEYAGVTTDAKKLVEDSPKIKYALEVLKTVKEDKKTKDFGTFIFFGKMGVEYHPMIAEYFAKELGYKPEQVAYLSGNVTDEQKEDIKERFNNGEIKVLLGGDQTKEGIDLQNNGFITLNLALGWNPTQIAQVEGRVWRQGNKRSIAPLIYPLVENSGDAMIYNKFEEKGGRINDLFSYAGTMFDVGEVDPAEKKLTLLTDPKDKAKMQIEIDKTVLYNERVLIDNDIKALNKIAWRSKAIKGRFTLLRRAD